MEEVCRVKHPLNTVIWSIFCSRCDRFRLKWVSSAVRVHINGYVVSFSVQMESQHTSLEDDSTVVWICSSFNMTEHRWRSEDPENRDRDGGRLSYRTGVTLHFGYRAQKAPGYTHRSEKRLPSHPSLLHRTAQVVEFLFTLQTDLLWMQSWKPSGWRYEFMSE